MRCLRGDPSDRSFQILIQHRTSCEAIPAVDSVSGVLQLPEERFLLGKLFGRGAFCLLIGGSPLSLGHDKNRKRERQCVPSCSHLPQGLQTKPCEPYDETCAIKAGEHMFTGSTVMLAHIHCSFINTLACCCRCQYTALARACCYYNWLMDKNCGQSAWLRLPSLEGVSACLQRFTAPRKGRSQGNAHGSGSCCEMFLRNHLCGHCAEMCPSSLQL